MLGENSNIPAILASILFAVFFCQVMPRASASDEKTQKLADEGIRLAYNLDFDKATQKFNQLIELEPDNPKGYLLQSISFYYRYQLGENHKAFAKEFLNLSKKTIRKAERLRSTPERKLDAMFYLGTTNMYLAAYYGWESKWIKAFLYGRKGISYLERLVELDPNYYDAYLGLGLYHYYTDILPTLAKPVTYLLGLRPDRAQGIRDLELAARKGTYSRAEALLFLGSIYLYIEKDYRKSLVYLEELSSLYPENASYLMLLGENYEKLDLQDMALETLTKLVADSGATHFPVLVTSSYFRLGNLYYNKKDLPQAIRNYHEALQHASQSTGNVRWVFALANLNLGRSFDLLGRRKEAVQYYRKVKKSDHKHAYEEAQKRLETPLKKTRVASRSKNYDEIIEMYQSAIAEAKDVNGSNDPISISELYYFVGKEFYERAIYNLAIRKLNKVAAMANVVPAWIKPWAQFYLGQCYVQTGRWDEAQRAFERAYTEGDTQLRAKIDGARVKLPEQLAN